MKKNKFYRILSLILFSAISLALLVACTAKLPEGFEEAEVKIAAEEVIYLLDQRDVDGLKSILTEDMKVGLTDEVREQIFNVLDQVGAVEEIVEIKTGGNTENNITYAVAVATVKHANQEVTYTISFTDDMKLAGLYLQ